jgi:hypothetical protein
LTPTYRNVNNKFSVKYYLNLVLVDEEDRRYFKQQVFYTHKTHTQQRHTNRHMHEHARMQRTHARTHARARAHTHTQIRTHAHNSLTLARTHARTQSLKSLLYHGHVAGDHTMAKRALIAAFTLKSSNIIYDATTRSTTC